jgi:hypothetical protein
LTAGEVCPNVAENLAVRRGGRCRLNGSCEPVRQHGACPAVPVQRFFVAATPLRHEPRRSVPVIDGDHHVSNAPSAGSGELFAWSCRGKANRTPEREGEQDPRDLSSLPHPSGRVNTPRGPLLSSGVLGVPVQGETLIMTYARHGGLPATSHIGTTIQGRSPSPDRSIRN